MTPRRVASVAVLSLAMLCAAWADPPKKEPSIKVEGDTVTVVKTFPVKLTATSGAGLYRWQVPDALKYASRGNVLTVQGGLKGTHQIRVEMISAKVVAGKPDVEFSTEVAAVTVVVGDLPPEPGPGPAPGPGPKPPDPTPDVPKDVPFAGVAPAGLRVLFVEESTKRTTLPASQVSILQGKKVADYLNAKTPLGPDGKQHEWWILDQNDDPADLAKHWQDAMKRKRGELPWVLIGNGKDGYEGPLPKTPGEFLALVEKYGGK